MIHRVTLQAVPRHLAPQVRRAARRTLATTGAPAGALTIRITDAEGIRQLNRDHAKADYPTDVLSFPCGERFSPSDDVYFGDIAIALPIAASQAQAGGHELTAEVALLTVHGVLHLLGHDHDRPSSQVAMWALQDRILADLGLPIRSPAMTP
ncbi:MAG: rRNA maturation RNase YbeY [Chloroflexi bacterium]|nr:rRNA maturation RNase YbeY [Chloroflexota bacterium]